MRAVYYLVDEYGHIMHVTCASPARTCFPDVVIQHPGTGMRIVQNLDEAIAGGPSKIADYFKSNDWHEAWPYLLEAENAETLGKLKSGTFIMHKQISDNGAVYYFGGPSNTEVTISSHEIALPLLPSGN